MKKPGFTLIEVIVVIALLSIMMGISVPRFTRMMAETNVGSTARRLAGEILYLRNLAAKDGRTYYINIDFAQNTYSVMIKKSLADIEVPEEPGFSFADEYERALEEAKYQKFSDEFVGMVKLKKKVAIIDVVLADGTVVDEELEQPLKIAFYPDGTADKATVHFTNPHNDYYTVEIRPLTSRAYVFDYYAEPKEEIELEYEEEEEDD